MGSVNRQVIVGKLGKDVEAKESASGVMYAFVSVATDDYLGKDADGKAKTETTWHDVVVFGPQVKYIGDNGRKGGTVYVEGRTEKKKDDKDVIRTRVVANTIIVLGSSGSSSNGSSNGSSSQSNSQSRGERATTQAAPPAQPAQQQAVAAGNAPDDDDLPF